MKLLVVAMLIGIVLSLGKALFAMAAGPSDDKRMVQALSVRVGLSVGLFLLLLVSWHFGLIDPHG